MRPYQKYVSLRAITTIKGTKVRYMAMAFNIFMLDSWRVSGCAGGAFVLSFFLSSKALPPEPEFPNDTAPGTAFEFIAAFEAGAGDRAGGSSSLRPEPVAVRPPFGVASLAVGVSLVTVSVFRLADAIYFDFQ